MEICYSDAGEEKKIRSRESYKQQGSKCCYPLHLSLTDLVRCQGGTKELVTILNRFGATACNNTHLRFLKKLPSAQVLRTRSTGC